MIAYKYKLYRTKQTRHLDNMLREACFVWNHALALQKRFYSLYGKYIPCATMQKHFAKRIKRTYLHSQSVQEVLDRLDKAYRRFFSHKAKRPPKYKSHMDFCSFCYKQGGFALNGNVFHVNSLKRGYKLSLSRPYEGHVKQLRVKRSCLGEYYICIVTDADAEARPYTKTHNGASVGIDFGLKTYMTFSDGTKLSHPQFLKRGLEQLRKVARNHSKTSKTGSRREYARHSLATFHEHLSNQRKDYQWKLAHSLCRQYDYIFVEDLCIKGMARHKHWGRKVNDLAHSQFVGILSQVAAKYGCTVHKVDRWYASSKLCDCGYKNNDLKLDDREWTCPVCGQVHDRDVHAAKNILREGIHELASGSKAIEALAKGHPASTPCA